MQKFCTKTPKGNRLSHYPWRLLLLILGGIHSALNAQECRLEWGGVALVNSYLGDANRVIPFASVGGGVGIQMRYNHNFRIAFSGDLTYNYIHGNSQIRNQVYPQQPKSTLRLKPYCSPLEGSITSLHTAISSHFSTLAGGVPTLLLGYP